MPYTPEPVTICDQFLRLILCKGKHEFWRKAICIALYSLIKNLCLDTIKLSKIPIQHNLHTTNRKYARLDKIVVAVKIFGSS